MLLPEETYVAKKAAANGKYFSLSELAAITARGLERGLNDYDISTNGFGNMRVGRITLRQVAHEPPAQQ